MPVFVLVAEHDVAMIVSVTWRSNVPGFAALTVTVAVFWPLTMVAFAVLGGIDGIVQT
jgi:uncharacterized membrane-anchored protein